MERYFWTLEKLAARSTRLFGGSLPSEAQIQTGRERLAVCRKLLRDATATPGLSGECRELLSRMKISLQHMGLILDIHEARRLVPHQQATTLQVAISVVAAAMWMIKNPKRGFILPDDLDHEFVLKVAKPYISPFISDPVDWTPLKNLNTKFTKFDVPMPSQEDVWQFTTFLVDHKVRAEAYTNTKAKRETAKIK